MKVVKKYYGVYDLSGDLVFVGRTQLEVGNYLEVNDATVFRTLRAGRRNVANHIVIKYDTEKELKKTIKVEKTYPKFRDPKDTRFKRMYLAYDLNAELDFERPLFMNEMCEKLGVHKDTVLDAVVKNHLANKHIIRVARSQTRFPKKLSPHCKEFKVFKYNRKGELVAWYTTMSVASRLTGIKYDIIRNCIVKHVSTHEKYYFTDHIPLVGYKKITVKFKARKKPVVVYVSQAGKREKMSLSKACTYIGTTYTTLKQKISQEPRLLYKGYLIELVSA